MKKKLALISFITLLMFPTLACDICGCGVGSYYIGILPDFSKKIMGLRYRYNTLRTHIGAGGATSYLTTHETYRTAEWWGGWTIGKKFRLMGYLPVSFNEKRNQGITTSKTGLGDIGLQGFYQVCSQNRTVGNQLLVHSLWLGAGVKAPTGNYDAAEKNNGQETANLFQLGTGSTDFTLNAMYDIRLMDAGFNTNVNYKINTTNRQGYRYGNKFNLNMQAYYKIRLWKTITVAPNAGIQYETATPDKDNGFAIEASGGTILMGTIGTELAWKRIALGSNFQTPFSQHLAGGFVQANNRAMMHLSFLF